MAFNAVCGNDDLSDRCSYILILPLAEKNAQINIEDCFVRDQPLLDDRN